MKSNSSLEPDNLKPFVWGDLPLEISYLILDALEWPAHAACRRVCHSWRAYLEQPRLVAKRYAETEVRNTVRHRALDEQGFIVTRVIEAPSPEGYERRPIHRIFLNPGFGFFLNQIELNEKQITTYFSGAPRSPYFAGGEQQTDLTQYHFPGAELGNQTGLIFDPDFDKQSDASSDSEPRTIRIRGVSQLRIDQLPFADDPVVLSNADSRPFEFGVDFLASSFPNTVGPLVLAHMTNTVNKLPRPPTVGELVYGIGKVIAIWHSLKGMDLNGIFLEFTNVINAHYTGTIDVNMKVSYDRGWISKDSDELRKIDPSDGSETETEEEEPSRDSDTH